MEAAPFLLGRLRASEKVSAIEGPVRADPKGNQGRSEKAPAEAINGPLTPRIAGVLYQDGRAKIVIDRRGAMEVVDSADFVVTETHVEGVVDGVTVKWP